ncbi:CHASE domain-containing protein [Ramlibacter sp. MAHUQ-53]|uniref:CHASE domain-containing protein n=1 Tax=unclassified Ramlibacter TaxID=2617605 RepID=UPI00363A378C
MPTPSGEGPARLAPSMLLRRAVARLGAWGVPLILLLGVSLTAWVAVATERAARVRSVQTFEGHVDRLAHEIVRRIERAENGLRGLSGAVALRPGMTADEFRRALDRRNLWHEFRGIRGFGLVVRVERDRLKAFVDAQHAAGRPAFQVKSRGAQPDLYLVKYIEPLAANEAALGFDLGADPVRRTTIDQALSSGLTTLTPRVTLLQDQQGGPGWVALLPVREDSADGSGRLVGLLHAAIVASEILGDLQAFTDFMLDYRLYDGLPAEGRLMSDSQGLVDAAVLTRGEGGYAGRTMQGERSFRVGERLMTLQAAAKPRLHPTVLGLSPGTVTVAVAGTVITLVVAMLAGLIAQGRARALALAHRMTADLERASVDLARGNERLHAVLDNLPCGLSVFDKDLRVVAQNAFLHRLLGLPEGEVVPDLAISTLLYRVEADGEPANAEAWVPITEAHRFERQLPDGRLLEIHAGPMPDGGFILTYVDHSARRQAEAALRASENLMRLVTDSIPGRVAYWDSAGRCRFANSEFLAGHAHKGLPMPGCHWTELYGDCADQPERPDRIRAALGGERQTFERTGPDPGGPVRTRQVHYIPDVADGRVQGFFAIGLDVTEIRQARDDALRASEAKSRFVANMSHELRTPMNAVLGMLQLVQHTPLTGQQEDYIRKAEGAAQALLSVLNDILDFSKVEAGKMTLDPRAFEVDALLRDLSVILATAVGAKPVDVLFDLHPQLPARLVTDDMRLRQVLINLAGNAIKFTERGSVVLSVAPVARDGSTVCVEFSIRDTGIGIAPRQLQRLFEDFGQAEASTTRRFGGTGLGLAISRRLVALLGGELRVESRAGEGSRFFFRLDLPAAPDDGAAPPPHRRVLVADPRAITREAHAAMLRALGWDVVEAGTADEAIARALEGGWHAVFIDWLMDREVALETARRIGDALGDDGPPVIVLGTAEVQELVAQLEPQRRRHLAACLTRPVTPRLLAQCVDAPRAPRQAPAQPDDLPLAGLRLLVAEDNENNQMVARELLSRQGARVDIAVDGVEAVEKVRAGGYDLVLMDWQMPRMDGLQATRAIRRIEGFADLPIVAMTANAMESDRRECLEAGMTDHVAKPFVLRELVAVLRAHARPGVPAAPRGDLPAPAPVPVAKAPQEAPGSADMPAATEARDGTAPREALLDRAGAVESLGGIESLYDELLPLFRAEAPRTLAMLVEACRSGAQQDAVRLAHTLKGTAGTVGARHLARVCKETEDVMARMHAPQDATVALQALGEAIDLTLAAMPA